MVFQSIWTESVSWCHEHPELLIFLSLAIGYAVGRIKVFGFSLGSTASVLLIALVFGQLDVAITPLIKSISFALFIFTIGYKVGPQFFEGLKKEGLNYLILSLFFAVVGLLTAIMLGKLFHFTGATTAGLLAGALTQSSVIGTAEGAVRTLHLDVAHQKLLNSEIAVAYAITYIFGVAGLILFYKIVPRLLRIDLKAYAQKVEAELSGNNTPNSARWNERPRMRIYRVTNPALHGTSVQKLYNQFPAEVMIEKIKRGSVMINPVSSTIIQVDDLVLVLGMRDQLMLVADMIGAETDDSMLNALPIEMIDVYVTKYQASGQKAEMILRKYGAQCMIHRITRQGHEVPLRPQTIIQRGDMVQIMGLSNEVDSFARAIGYAERDTNITDLIMVSLGCFLGTVLGLVLVQIGPVVLTLGVGGGVLLAGLFFGWLHVNYPLFGGIPAAAQWLLSDLGLNIFIACIGLTAGPQAMHALQQQGVTLLFAGMLLTLVPHILGIMFGLWVLRLNPILLFGALTGAGTATPSLNVLKEECESSVPALGYTVPYAIGNFILTIWGTVIINLM